MKIKNIFSIFKKKYLIYWITIIIIAVVAWFIWKNNTPKSINSMVIHPSDFLQQVSVSGNVIPIQNLDLSFEQAGKITGVYAVVGNNVLQGKLLVSQNSSDLDAQLAEMQAGIDLQQAKLNQLTVGSSPDEIKIAQDAVDSDQQTLNNYYSAAKNYLNSAYSYAYSADSNAIFMQNTYFPNSDQQGIKVSVSRTSIDTDLADIKSNLDSENDNNLDLVISNVISDLNSIYNSLKVIRQQCDDSTYYSKILSTDKTVTDTQITNINTAVTNLTTSQQNISSAKINLQQAQDQLTLKKAPARASDIAVYQAQIDQAKASEQNIVAQISKRKIYSPINGVATVVNAKVGSVMSANDVAISVISTGTSQIESFVPETNISYIQVGNPAAITLDAYGPDIQFSAKVISIDPAKTIHDGVSTYRIKLQFDNQDDRIKSGMTANVLITTEKKSGVISVPQGIIINKKGKKFVQIRNGENIVEQEVKVGEISSSGQIEITSGLKDGDIVLLINQ